jgi:type I restriction enzyme M protein
MNAIIHAMQVESARGDTMINPKFRTAASRRVRKGKPKNYIPEDAIRPLAAAYLKGESVEGEIAVITRQQAEEADYNLSPSRWVSGSETEAVGSIASMLVELEHLSAQDLKLTADLLALLRPLAAEHSHG